MRPLLTEETAIHNYSKRFSFRKTSQNLKENTLASSLLHKKCSYLELFWSGFCCIRTKKIPNMDTFNAVFIPTTDFLNPRTANKIPTAQKILISLQIQHKKLRFSLKDFFIKCDQIRRKLRIWSYLLKKTLMENLNFLCSIYSEISVDQTFYAAHLELSSKSNFRKLKGAMFKFLKVKNRMIVSVSRIFFILDPFVKSLCLKQLKILYINDQFCL